MCTMPNITPYERLRKTLAHQQPDRPPIHSWLTSEVQTSLESHFQRCFGNGNVLDILDVDFRWVGPRWKQQECAVPAPAASALPNGIYQDVRVKPLAWIRTLDDVSRYKPERDPEAFDFSVLADMCKATAPFIRVFGSPGLFDIVNGLGARGFGLEDLLCNILTEDPVTVAVVDKHLEHDYEFCRRGLEAGHGQIEILHIGEDCGNQRAALFPPSFFRTFFAPRLRRFADLAHRHGAACMLHSCGSMRELLPILIDEVGLDIQDACQPEAAGMEPEGLKRDFGGRITFCGMLSLQKTLTHGTPEDCRREARRLIDRIGEGGGYIFSPANTITKDTPLENILAAYEVATGKRLQQGPNAMTGAE